MIEQFEALLQACPGVCPQERSRQRLQRHLLSQLLCLGRHTLTGLLTTSGQTTRDWSADYRLYADARVNTDRLFHTVRQGVEAMLPADAPLVVAMDDSLLRKTGRKIPGTGWRRDPLGPKFQTNLVWGQRVLQISAALPAGSDGAARMLPIDFQQAPMPARPRKKDSADAWQDYRAACKKQSINVVAAQRLSTLAAAVSRRVQVTVDGRFTNATVLKKLPSEMTLIGRVRKDAKLYQPACATAGANGRPRRYGARLPAPEEIRQDDSYPWQTVRARAASQQHEFKVKLVRDVKWRPAGVDTSLQLLIIAPLGYRLRVGGRVLYRQPAYLICTDSTLSVQEMLQHYLWRWDIEVNFRDEKSVLGVSEGQVRNPASVQSLSASAVAAYSLLLLAAAQTYGPAGQPDTLPLPAWRRNQVPQRATTNGLINQLRYELWGRALGASLCGFSTPNHRHQKLQKPMAVLASAVFNSRRA